MVDTFPDTAEPTPLPRAGAPDTGPLPVDSPACPYPTDGLPSLLREDEPKLESPKSISAENECPTVPTPLNAFTPVTSGPELRSWECGELKPAYEWALYAAAG